MLIFVYFIVKFRTLKYFIGNKNSKKLLYKNYNIFKIYI